MSMRMNSSQQHQPPAPQPFPTFSPPLPSSFSSDGQQHDFSSFSSAGVDGQGNARLLQQLQAQQQYGGYNGGVGRGLGGGVSPSPPLHEASPLDDDFPPLLPSPVLSNVAPSPIRSPARSRTSSNPSASSPRSLARAAAAANVHANASSTSTYAPSPLAQATPPSRKSADVKISIQSATPQNGTPALGGQEWWDSPDGAAARAAGDMLRTDWQPSQERRRSLERLTEVLGEDWQSASADEEAELLEEVAESVAAVVIEDEATRAQADIETKPTKLEAIATPSAPPGLSRPASRAPSPPLLVVPEPELAFTPAPPAPVDAPLIIPSEIEPIPKIITTISSRPSTTPVSTSSNTDKPKSNIFLPLASDRELVVEPSRSTKAKLKKAEKEKAKLEKERIKLEQVKAELEVEKEKLRAANLEKAKLEKEIRARLEKEREEKERAVIERERELTAMLDAKEQEDKPVEKVKGKKGAVAQPSNKALRAAVKAGMAAAFAPSPSLTSSPFTSSSSSSRPSLSHSKSSSGNITIDIPLSGFPALSGLASKTPTKSATTTSVTTIIGKGGKPTLIPTLSTTEQAPIMGRMTKKSKGPKQQTPKKVVEKKVKKEEVPVVVAAEEKKKKDGARSLSPAVGSAKLDQPPSVASSPSTATTAPPPAQPSFAQAPLHHSLAASGLVLVPQSEDEWSSSSSSSVGDSVASEHVYNGLPPGLTMDDIAYLQQQQQLHPPKISPATTATPSKGAEARVEDSQNPRVVIAETTAGAEDGEEEEFDPYSLPAMLESISQVMDCSTLAFFEPLPSHSSPPVALPPSQSDPAADISASIDGPSFSFPLDETTTAPPTTAASSLSGQILDAQSLALALSALSTHHPTITMEQAVSSFHQLLTLLTDKITSVLGVLPRDREIEGGVASRFSEMFGDVGAPSSSDSSAVTASISAGSDLSRPRGTGGGRLGDGFDELDDELDEFGRTGEFGPGGGTMDEVERLKRALIRRAGYLAKQLGKLESLHTEINQIALNSFIPNNSLNTLAASFSIPLSLPSPEGSPSNAFNANDSPQRQTSLPSPGGTAAARGSQRQGAAGITASSIDASKEVILRLEMELEKAKGEADRLTEELRGLVEINVAEFYEFES